MLWFGFVEFTVHTSIFCLRFSQKQSANQPKKLQGNGLLLNWKAHAKLHIDGGGEGQGELKPPLNENLGGLSPPTFRSRKYRQRDRKLVWQNIPRLAKYYFLGLFEQLHPAFSEHLEELQRSCFGTDIDWGLRGHQLYHVHDAVKTTLPEVRQVTNIRTYHLRNFQQNSCHQNATIVGKIHKLLRLYLTFIPVASATSERSFSSVRRLKTDLP